MIQIKITQQGSEAPQKAEAPKPKPQPEPLPKLPRQLYRITAVAWRNGKQVRNQLEPWLTSEYWVEAWAEELKEMHKRDRYIIAVELYFTEKEVFYYSNF